ncbi:MAG: epoxyqueuosine reductase [Clostridia bacterium]|nr:epoxyqueuosine reductase [Clostridia bacterium]
MELLEFARKIFAREKIEYVSLLGLSDCRITRAYLLERAGIGTEKGTVIMLAVPYYVSDGCERNISLYAAARDYHSYFSDLFERILPQFREAFPGCKFAGFADHSPIDELRAAAMSGLGIIGKNHLLITEKYSSFVFLGEIVCDIETDSHGGEIKRCEGCGLCERECPAKLESSLCLSAVTQKKGELSDIEKDFMLSGGSAWGCDICQTVCPHSRHISESEIEFFREKRIPFLTSEIIENMGDEDFAERAYSWRGRDVILRNLRIFENKEQK